MITTNPLKNSLQFAMPSKRWYIMQKHEIIVVSMCDLEHFTVILGYPNARRWDYYNSMPQYSRLERVKCGECFFMKDFA